LAKTFTDANTSGDDKLSLEEFQNALEVIKLASDTGPKDQL